MRTLFFRKTSSKAGNSWLFQKHFMLAERRVQNCYAGFMQKEPYKNCVWKAYYYLLSRLIPSSLSDHGGGPVDPVPAPPPGYESQPGFPGIVTDDYSTDLTVTFPDVSDDSSAATVIPASLVTNSKPHQVPPPQAQQDKCSNNAKPTVDLVSRL